MALPQPSWGLLGASDAPSSPRTMRTLRKIQSHQVLTTSSALIAQTQSSHLSATHGTDIGLSGTQSGSTIRTPARRPRSNSDAAAREASSLVAPVPTQRRPARKTGSGVGIKRSLLENLVRDGPHNGNTKQALQELKYLVLSTGVDADGDGMVSAPNPCFGDYLEGL
jgi:cell cycle arrest protein BUB2